MKTPSKENAGNDLSAIAAKRLTALSGTAFMNLHPSAEVTTAEGEKLMLFTANATDEANGKSFSVAFTAEGKELKPEELKAKRFTSADVLEVKEDSLRPYAFATLPISISPDVNDLTLDECKRFSEVITVTIPKNPKRQIDIYFLADSTGSMGGIIEAVKTGANNILTTINALGHDIAYGVGNYKDFQKPVQFDPYAFQHQLAPTTSAAAVTTAINAWSASGGSDGPEGQLFALDQLAQTPAGSIGWRNGSKRIIVWFGDQPGHEPICTPVSGLSYSIDEVLVKNKLTIEKIAVLAISVGANNLNGDPTIGSYSYGTCTPGGTSGQAQRIANATGGAFSSGINTTNIVNTIITLINNAVSVIGNVSLVAAGGTAPFVTSIEPAGGFGPLSGDLEHQLKFKVGFTGIKPCDDKDQDYYGSINVVADGVVVAAKKVHIKVPACCRKRRYSYSVKFVIGTQEKQKCNTNLQVNSGVYTTEVNIHNYQNKEAIIEKLFIPLVFGEKVIGREPSYAKVRATDKIVLPPHTATMDDNYRISSLLHEGDAVCNIPVSIGFMHIISNVELAVTAVYTTADLEKRDVTSIAVEQINAKELPL